jgi:hypothetical protein
MPEGNQNTPRQKKALTANRQASQAQQNTSASNTSTQSRKGMYAPGNILRLAAMGSNSTKAQYT